MPLILMHLKVLLPFQILIDNTEVSHIVAETSEGAYGFLPHRLDCVTALLPGILTFFNQQQGEVFVAVDEGILVKTGTDVLVSVRSAMIGNDLTQLRATVEKDFLALDEEAVQVRSIMAKLESNFLNRFVSFQQT
ncbi:F0F1 ATP synthase subunit epsilon [Paraglaciecola sp.]|uniref:F0F1 ATP synthase subunit epsilon n=1 Tax=Paraglaciecola sp. TaxID=1920173 RepID=UPI0030F4512C